MSGNGFGAFGFWGFGTKLFIIRCHKNARRASPLPEEIHQWQRRKTSAARIDQYPFRAPSQFSHILCHLPAYRPAQPNSPGFLHMIAGNRNQLNLGMLEEVYSIISAIMRIRLRRVNIGVAHHKFLENIVLNGARKHLVIMALLFTRDNEIGQNRDHRRSSSSRRRLYQAGSLRKDFHILNAVDRNAGFAPSPITRG